MTICIVHAARVDDEGDVAEGPGELEGVRANLPDVVPPADVEGRGGRLPRGTGIDVFKLERDVANVGAPETRALTLTQDVGSKLFELRLLSESTTQSQPT